jgi:hypothetical protein
MVSTHDGELDIPSLPLAARRAHIVPALNGQSLISLGQLCDSGCEVSLNASSITVTHDTNIIFTGTRDAATKLWVLTAPTIEISNAAVGAPSPADLVTFAHAALFSPALTTLELALKKGYVENFPGLTASTLRKYPPTSRAMVKGHLDQIRKNVRSTQIRTTKPQIDATNDAFPSDMPHVDNNNTVFADVLNIPDATGKIFTDQPGKFIAPSSTGNNYIFILYDYDSNAILAHPMPNRTAGSILAAYKHLHALLVKAGRTPRLQRIDNECSESLQQFMASQGISYQLVPPGMHRRNAAERAIRTFKNHFIAGLSSTDSNFPIHLWDKLLEQAILTLNLLRGSRVNPKLSAWAQLFGTFDYNATPLAPPGINVLVHDKPQDRDSWAPHASAGWYIGPALKSYRCFKCFMQDTQAVRVSDTVVWFPDKLPIPTFKDVLPPGTDAATPLRVATDNSAMPSSHSAAPLRVPAVCPPTPVAQIPTSLRVVTVPTDDLSPAASPTLPGSFAALTYRRQRRSTARRKKRLAKTADPRPFPHLLSRTDHVVQRSITTSTPVHINVNLLVLRLPFPTQEPSMPTLVTQ